MLNSIVKERILPPGGGIPQLGKVGKLALEASLLCPADLSSTYSVG
jgi:hypothetical protein